MGPTNTASKKACIATAIVLLGLGLVAAPTAVADDPTPQIHDDGSIQSQEAECYYIDPWGPGVEVALEDCI